MPGSTSIPTIAAGETGFTVTIHWIDDNEKEYASSFQVKSSVSDAELQTLVTKSQAGSNASSWKIELAVIWEGAKAASNAASAVHESVADKIRYSMKAISTKGYNHAYLPAPLEVLIGDNGIVDTTQAGYTEWRDAVNAIKLALFDPLNVAFVQYQQRNDSTTP